MNMVRMDHVTPGYRLNRRRGQHFAKTTFLSKCLSRRCISMLLGGVMFGYLFTAWNVFGNDITVEHPKWIQNNNGSSVGNSIVGGGGTGSHAEQSLNIRGSNANRPQNNVNHDEEKDPDPDPADLAAAKDDEEELKDNVNHDEEKDPDPDPADLAAAKDYEEELKDSQEMELNELRHDKLSISRSVVMEEHKYFSSQSLPTTTAPYVMKTPKLPDSKRLKIMVTGGAGFVGSHLVDKLMQEGHEVFVVDNFFTGQKKNIEHWLHHPNFSLHVHDVTEPIMLEVDQIYHLACPASPPHYQYNPVKTIKTSTMGTINMLGLAKRVKARILLSSTSEIYGDPLEHPQKESYWGNVNAIGPRSCYDEGKRVAETMMYSYRNQNNVEVRVARIFNTFGPRMHPNDGRVVSNFIIQALQNIPLTIYGDGSQTRSFQYVTDLVDGLHALMNGDYDMPVNLGNPDEYTVKRFAEHIIDITKSQSEITFLQKNQDDPTQRRPDIQVAKREINWEPKVNVEDGLAKAITYFKSVLDTNGKIVPTGAGAAKPKGGDAVAAGGNNN